MDSKEVFMSMWNLIWSKLIEFGSNEQSADHSEKDNIRSKFRTAGMGTLAQL